MLHLILLKRSRRIVVGFPSVPCRRVISDKMEYNTSSGLLLSFRALSAQIVARPPSADHASSARLDANWTQLDGPSNHHDDDPRTSALPCDVLSLLLLHGSRRDAVRPFFFSFYLCCRTEFVLS